MALVTLKSVQEEVVAALVRGVGYPPELFGLEVDLVNDLGMTPEEINDAVTDAERRLGIPPHMALPPEQHPTIASIAQGILKTVPQPVATGREVTLEQVLAFVDDCARRNLRPPLETLLDETERALARMDAAKQEVAPVPGPSVPAASVSSAEVMKQLVDALVERTGYPADMLEPDLDLEADLGIDTVKQVEAFAQVRVSLNVEKDGNFRLRDYNTLRKMVDYLLPRASGGTAAVAATPVAPPAVSSEKTLEFLQSEMAKKTGYALDILQPDLDLEVDLGIDTITQIEVFAVARTQAGLERDENFRVRNYNTLRKMAEYLDSKGSGSAPAAVAASPAAVATPAAAPAPVVPQPRSAPPAQADAITKQLVDALVERTGYPADMLEPDLDLEADLGIDTVKQVEAFAQVRVSLNVEKDGNFRLRDYNTLRKMVDYLLPRASGGTAAVAAAPVSAALPQQPAMTASSAAPTAGASEEKILAFLVTTFQEKTGYHTEILGPDFDLEVDLGIDPQTQLDAFSLARAAFGVAPDERFRVREHNTLRKMTAYLAGNAVPSKSGPPAQAPDAPGELSLDEVRRFMAQCEATGDAESLRRLAAHLRAKLEAPAKPLIAPARLAAKRYEVHPVEQPPQATRENLAHLRGKTIGITADAQGAHKALAKRLESAGARVVILQAGPASVGTTALDWAQPETAGKRLQEFQAAQPLDGLILLHTCAPAPKLAELDAATWASTVNAFTLGLYYSALSVYDRIGTLAGGGWYLVATSGGGLFGHRNAEGRTPLAGASGGFIKCLKRELPAARCKAVDLDPREPSAWAEQLWTELVSADPDVEVGYSGGRRYVFRDIETPLPDTERAASIPPGSVVLVSGGGRGVVYHCAKLLAQVTGARVIITGRTVPPTGNEEWLNLSEAELPAYRMRFVKRHMAAHPGATPVQGMKAFDAEIARRRELHQNLEDCRTQGIPLDYKVCDMTELDAVRRLLAQVRQQYGRIDGIVHGATIEESKSLPMKSADAVVRTLASKAHLWQLLVQETRGDALQFFINFGSGSGRYGNQGQTDYSAANALVAKAGLVYGALRPEVRSVTIDWPVWVGAGIVENNRDYLERLSTAGVCVIDIAEGAYWFVGELLHGGRAGEVVIADDRTFASRGWPRHGKEVLEVTAQHEGGTRYAV